MKPFARHSAVAVLVLSALFPSGVFLPSARAEAILQCFNLSHNEIAARIPEMAEAGYSALWIPPPTKANGGMSVGYDLYDPFDIGSTDLRGQYPTRYGTKADLLNLIDVAHRFGMRVYFDNVMNHRAYDVPGCNETTPVDVYPGMVAEDFHLSVTSDGYYRMWPEIVWGGETAWDVMYRPLSGLIDIAHENIWIDGTPHNGNFGRGDEMGQKYPKPYIVRHAYRKEDTWKLFDRMPVPWKRNEDYSPGDGALQNTAPDNGFNLYTGFGNSAWNPDDPATKALIEEHSAWFAANDASNGVSMALIENYPNFYAEKVDEYLNRAVRWLIDATHVDGLRLDAVKHVPYEFFGDAYGADKDKSDFGYLGQAQWQFNMTRGFNDWTNHRNTVFSNDGPRDDLMAFGEHLGGQPAQQPYIDAGMRLVDSDLRSALDNAFKFNQLWGFEWPGHAGFGPDHGVMHAQSHDDDHVDRKQLHHAYYYMRSGLGLVYTDGNNRAAVLPGSGGAFPRWACTDYLGQWGQSQIPTLLKVHENFAMYDDNACTLDPQPGNFIAWERGGGWPWNRVLVMFNSHRDDGQTIWTGGSYPDGDYLYNYASTYPDYMTHWEGGTDDAPYATAGDLRAGKVWIPKSSYALWGYKNPDPSEYWAAAVRAADYAAGCTNTSRSGLSDVITVYDDGRVAPVCGVVRTDGVDGDPGFNPNGVEDADPTDSSYTMAIPVVRGTNVAFGIHLDGEAEHVMARLDGGMDFGNGIEGTRSDIEGEAAKDPRDNPPGAARDCFLGFENIDSYFIQRTWAEVFAAKDTHTTDHGCVLQSGDATTYEVAIGGAARIWTNSYGIAFNTDLKNPSFLYHDPEGTGTYRDTTASPAQKAAAAVGATCTDHAGETGDWPAAAIDGFKEWQVEVYGTGDGEHYAGGYVESPADAAGIEGFEGAAYELYANPDSTCGVTVTRRLDLAEGAAVSNFSITLGFNFDSGIDGSYRGFELLDASGGKIFAIQMGHSPVIYWEGGGESGIWSEEYPGEDSSPQAFQVSLSRTDTGYEVSGTTRLGGDFAGAGFADTREIAAYKVYMNGSQSDERAQVYFNDATYTTMEGGSSGGGEEPAGTDVTFPQFSLDGGRPVVYAKMAHGNGLAAWLYCTTNGAWPNGCAGKSPDRNVSVVSGEWVGNQWEQAEDTGKWKLTGDWWRFTLPALPDGTVLKYKIGGAALQGDTEKGFQGWETVWPGSADAVWRKTKITGEWRVPREGGLDLTKQQYHKHLDYASWTTGFDEGFHLFTVRCWPDREKAAEIFNTFRQTFYMDRETPRGRILWPAQDGERIDGKSYRVAVQTDRTVEKVYYHITDASAGNDGPGNGTNAAGRVEWAEAEPVGTWTEDMATNTALPKVWAFNYNGIAPSNRDATIRVRLWEWSSAPTNRWSATSPAEDDLDALHVTEIPRTVKANGDPEYVYVSWPATDESKTLVEAGWKVWVRFTGNLVSGENVRPEDVFAATTVYINTTNSASSERGDPVEVQWDPRDFSWPREGEWNDGRGECQMAFTMPNVYNGDDAFLYNITVAIDKNARAEGSRLVRHKGPRLPACIIATPPETDSDGVKYVITMQDSPAVLTNATLRQTPVVVHTDRAVTNLDISFVRPAGYKPDLVLTNIETNSTALVWKYVWTVAEPGEYTFVATATADLDANTNLSVAVNSATRNATVQFRQMVETTNAADLDWDDDGVANTDETTPVALPAKNAEQWSQWDVFTHFRNGRSDRASPDSDCDGLPDGLELGVRWPVEGGTNGTDVACDTNGDGWKNFRPDLDPPFYNTTDNDGDVKGISRSGSGARRDVIAAGTVTDPNNPDTDYDGLPDGLEDSNRNGWTDGDGQPLPPDKGQSRDRTVPNGLVDGGETWQETSPCLADSDGDGLSDGYGEDKDLDGKTAIFLRDADGNDEPIDLSDDQWAAYRAVPANALSRAVNWKKLFADYAVDGTYSGARQKGNGGWPHLVVTETDPLNKDTDGDGLPDGWEIRYGLDPLDNGFYNFATGLAVDPTNSVNGAGGNPDEDLLYNADGSTTPNTNLLEYQAGTNPRTSDSIENPGGAGSIVVGTGAEIGKVNETVYRREFLDWTLDDLIAFDDYDQGGKHSDIYRWRDGYDSSRDIVAFYFRDGGVESEGGDGKLYFRVDLDDLAEGAENGKLDIYVAINFGTPGNGEAKLPDEVNALTDMGWNAVVGVWNSSEGVVYVDRDPDNNSKGHSDDLGKTGIVKGTYHGACFNHELDSVMWYIDRADLGSVNPDMFLFQVYTVRDGTQDDGSGGSDKTRERNDFTDTIGDDWICSDDEDEAATIALNGSYSSYFGKHNAWNDCGKHAKIALVAHGNQAIEAGSTIQALVDNGAGAGYQRPIKIHNIYTNCPLNLHITPTLAMALEWAKAGTEKTWFSGPALNAEIRSGVAKGNFRLLGSTFSDHILPYFPEEFNRADVALAAEILDAIYGNGGPAVSTNIFWAPERVLDGGTLGQIGAMGYKATLIDQTPHMLEWFNRETSLSSPGYKIQDFWIDRGGNRWVNTRAFVLTTAVDEFRYLNTDNGLPSDLRHLFLRRARSGEAALSSIFYMWEELKEGKNADAYDRNLRWIANHPWTRVVALEDVLDDGNLLRGDDIRLPDPSVLPLEAHDWVHHASNENYDNWYYGSDRHEGLAGKTNEVRYGVPLPSGKPFGTKENGILADTWATVSGIRNADVKRLAQETLFASVFETAFHEESNNNLSRWSYGTYVSPATGLKDNGEKMGLQSFSWRAQSRTRLANVFGEVDDWANRTLPDVEVREKDVDLDGDAEYILRNNRLMALFEREGGLMVGAWLKDGGRVRQVVGNFAAIPENGYEDEESDFVRYVKWDDGSKHGYLTAQRGSALKDVEGGSRTALYDVSTTATGLTFTHGSLSKTVSLASPATNAFAVSYTGSGALKVRSGLSPDLDALMLTGQANMTETADGSKKLSVTAIRPAEGTGVTATLDVTRGAIDTAATDRPEGVPEEFNTVNMRNAAHVRQVDVTGSGSLAFTLAFTVEDTENLPPVITVSPDNDPQVFPVGVTTSFSVKATDPDSAAVTLKCENLPETFASFSETTHVFSWTPASLTQGTRTSDFATNVTFTATDGVNTTSRTVNILIPWDSDGDGLPDDWEYLRFGTFDQNTVTDWDRDEFPDWNEYVAGTSPTDPSDYLGWESLFVDTAAGSATLTFPSVPGKRYAIEASDGPAALVAPDWKEVALPTASGLHTTWVDTDPASTTRMYRIRVLFP
ncbi:MAG: hypothetical protein IKO01_12875 [Kiritimatiellae bacterium]|nr:hypothetical protein [Kiritimatiellia bacterium]